jgi:hypothetical protein
MFRELSDIDRQLRPPAEHVAPITAPRRQLSVRESRHFIASCKSYRLSKLFVLALLELDGRDWPPSIVSLDRDSQTVKLVQPNILNRSSFSIGENDSLADKLGLRVPERGEDRRRASLHSCHWYPPNSACRRDV